MRPTVLDTVKIRHREPVAFICTWFPWTLCNLCTKSIVKISNVMYYYRFNSSTVLLTYNKENDRRKNEMLSFIPFFQTSLFAALNMSFYVSAFCLQRLLRTKSSVKALDCALQALRVECVTKQKYCVGELSCIYFFIEMCSQFIYLEANVLLKQI